MRPRPLPHDSRWSKNVSDRTPVHHGAGSCDLKSLLSQTLIALFVRSVKRQCQHNSRYPHARDQRAGPCLQQTQCRSAVQFFNTLLEQGIEGSQLGIQIRTMRVVKGLYLLNRRLLAGVHKADVALAADCYQ